MFINKNSMKDVPMLKHHYHTITHCVKIFLQSITTRNVIKIDTAFNNISDFLDFRSDIYVRQYVTYGRQYVTYVRQYVTYVRQYVTYVRQYVTYVRQYVTYELRSINVCTS